MFSSLPTSASRNYRTIAASVAVHVALLGAVLLRNPRVLEFTPEWLAYGDSSHTYRITYFPAGLEDRSSDEKLVLPRDVSAPRKQPHPPAARRRPVPQQVPLDAEAADHNARAGSPLGTLIEGPIAGHEVHVAYPVVFPDPPVARSQIPAGLTGDVIVEVTIDAQGNVVETRVVEAIGHGIDERIVATLRQWRYQPATLDGVPVASKHDVHFHFPS